ncbi:MAG: hypothetical protein EZS28_023188, partial [Streblomastix strix]
MNITISNSSDIYEILNCRFTNCSNTGDSEETYGGALFLNISNYGVAIISDSTFTGCISDYGGAIYMLLIQGGQVTIYNTSIQDCIAINGGGIFFLLFTGSQVTIVGSCLFSECRAEYGGGIYAQIYGNASQVFFQDIFTLQRCSSNISGGGAYIYSVDTQIVYGKIEFDQCSAKFGGGLFLSGNNTKLVINETYFQFCSAELRAGGIRLFTEEQYNSIVVMNTIINYCNAQTGGGIYCDAFNSDLTFNNITVNYCFTLNGSGGGMYCDIYRSSRIILDQQSKFLECRSESGNGGGIYIDIDFATQCYFIIQDATIQDSQAIADPTIEKPPTGFGGGIFLTGSGDYQPKSQRLNFAGMMIYNNSADNGGMSLFVSISKVKQWCYYGDDGEYVKGNYSDVTSNKFELLGIPLNSSQFKNQTINQIDKKQKYLEYWWTHKPLSLMVIIIIVVAAIVGSTILLCISCCCCRMCCRRSRSYSSDSENYGSHNCCVNMDKFHLIYLIFSIIQFLCGVQSLIFSLAIYLPRYGFQFLSIFWLVNAVWLLIYGVEGIIYSMRNGGKRYKLILNISAFFVGVFFFGSMLLMNPYNFIISNNVKFNSLQNTIDENEIQDNIRQLNNVIDDQQDAYIF